MKKPLYKVLYVQVLAAIVIQAQRAILIKKSNRTLINF